MNSIRHPSSMPRTLRSLGTLVCGLLVCGVTAAAAYRYKDSSGQWVYTDRPPPPGQATQSVALGGSSEAPLKMTVEPRSTESGVALVAVNRCQCIVEFAVKAQTPAGNKQGRGTVAPQSERVRETLQRPLGPRRFATNTATWSANPAHSTGRCDRTARRSHRRSGSR